MTATPQLTFTENGALANKGTGNPCLDLFTYLVRNVEQGSVRLLMENAWNYDPVQAVKVIFLNRDIRGGKGERLCSYYALMWLREHKPLTYSANLPKIIAEYGCYVDLLNICLMSQQAELPLLGTKNEMLELEVLADQLAIDVTNLEGNMNKVSLAGKWAPTERCKFDQKKGHARKIANLMFPGDPKALMKYRKQVLTPLRAHLKIVETQMGMKLWDQIKYSAVPSKAALRYKKAFKKHDEARYLNYLNDCATGKEKINAGTLHANDLVAKYYAGDGYESASSMDLTVEAQWNAMVADLKTSGKFTDHVLPIVDVSGSMSGEPMQVAIALGLICCLMPDEKSPWYRKVVTFDDNPSLFDVQGETLFDMVSCLAEAPWGGSTNFTKTFDLILDMKARMPDILIPSMVICFTDMQFNEAGGNREERELETVYEGIRRKFEAQGLTVPKFVFWNLRDSSAKAFPVACDTPNTALVSGFSQMLLKVFMEGIEDFTPDAILNEMLSKYTVVIHPSEMHVDQPEDAVMPGFADLELTG